MCELILFLALKTFLNFFWNEFLFKKSLKSDPIFSSKILKPKGVLVSKVFMGDDFLEVKKLAKSLFKEIHFFKPNSSRDQSKETYLHCKNLRSL